MTKKYSTKSFFIDDEMIEAQTREDLLKYQKISGKTLSFPLYPDEIMLSVWGVGVEYSEEVMSNDGEPVLACFSSAEKKVYLNTSLRSNEGQVSFTLAHECGHISLHNFLTKSKKAMSSDKGNDSLEKQADRYASMFLMPKEFMLTKLEELGYVASDKLDLSLHGELLRKYFGVSHQALEIRLGKLGVVTTNGLYGIKPKKIAEKFFDEMELKRKDWNWKASSAGRG